MHSIQGSTIYLTPLPKSSISNMTSSYRTSPRASNYNTPTTQHQNKITTKSFQKSENNTTNNNNIVHHHNQVGQEVVVVVVPFPAQGHLNQLLHLSRLILSHNIPVHFVGTPTHNRQALTRVQGWDPHNSTFQIHDFKVPPFHSPPPNPNDQATKFPSHLLPSFQASSNYLRAPVASLLRSLASVSKRVVVIHDSLMASVVQDAVDIPNCENYTFHSVSAFTMFLYFWDAMGRPFVPNSFQSIPEVPSLEGCFTREFVEFIASQYEFHKSSNGTIYNTTRAIEEPYMELIERMVNNKTHWALGPFNPLKVENNDNDKKKLIHKPRHPCMNWLDKQGVKSVMYVSFGTTTAFTEEQIKELAIGLERSEVKFVWVLRDADKGDVFDNEDIGGRVVDLLPKGFEERIIKQGIVVKDWAPQLEILGHKSIGGFMSHCGWNSCMESITMGVPIAAWPMHSDQPRNRVLVTEVLKVGIVVKDWERREEVVRAETVEKVVRRLMEGREGEEMRERARWLRKEIEESKAETGVSRVEMDSFIAHITR